jgi:hypothetical protein
LGLRQSALIVRIRLSVKRDIFMYALSVEECERRDVKGFYKKAKEGFRLTGFPRSDALQSQVAGVAVRRSGVQYGFFQFFDKPGVKVVRSRIFGFAKKLRMYFRRHLESDAPGKWLFRVRLCFKIKIYGFFKGFTEFMHRFFMKTDYGADSRNSAHKPGHLLR